MVVPSGAVGLPWQFWWTCSSKRASVRARGPSRRSTGTVKTFYFVGRLGVTTLTRSFVALG